MLNPENIDRLERLCQWDDPGHCAQGKALAESLLGEVWNTLKLEPLLEKPKLADFEALWLTYFFAECLQEDQIDPKKCLSILPKLRSNTTLARQLLLDWPRAGRYTYPSFDLGWHLVNAGLYQARQLANAQLFEELLLGVELSPNRDGFSVDPERSLLPVKEGFEILIDHEIRGLVGFAPDQCKRANSLRSGIERLVIDASFDVYKWEREFPVDCSPIAHFENLQSLEISAASPLIQSSRLQKCKKLKEPIFHDCHLPWTQQAQWSLDELRQAAAGKPILPPSWKSADYICLESGNRIHIEVYGDPYHPKAKAPDPLQFNFDLDSVEARILRQILSDKEQERQQGLLLANKHLEASKRVVWVESGDLETWGSFPRVQCPNTTLVGASLFPEVLELILSRKPHEFAGLKSMSLKECHRIHHLDFLAFLPSLQTLDMRRCEKLTHLKGLEYGTKLQRLSLRGASQLETLAGIEHCEQLVSFEISLNDRLHDLGLLGSLAHLRHVEMGFCGFQDLTGLPAGFALNTLDLHSCSSLESLEGIEALRQVPQGGPTKLNLRDCTTLKSTAGLGAALTNLHVNFTNCRLLEDLDGLKSAQQLEKLLLILSGCQNLKNLSVLNELTYLKKVHINLAGLDHAPQLLESLALPDKVKLVVERRAPAGAYNFG